MAVQLHKRLFSVEEYYSMLSAGILTEEDKVELIQGEIFQKERKSSPHAFLVNKLTADLFPFLHDYTFLRIHNPIQLSEFTELEPDIAIIKGPIEKFIRPSSKRAGCLISDRSIRYNT